MLLDNSLIRTNIDGMYLKCIKVDEYIIACNVNKYKVSGVDKLKNYSLDITGIDSGVYNFKKLSNDVYSLSNIVNNIIVYVCGTHLDIVNIGSLDKLRNFLAVYKGDKILFLKSISEYIKHSVEGGTLLFYIDFSEIDKLTVIELEELTPETKIISNLYTEYSGNYSDEYLNTSSFKVTLGVNNITKECVIFKDDFINGVEIKSLGVGIDIDELVGVRFISNSSLECDLGVDKVDLKW